MLQLLCLPRGGACIATSNLRKYSACYILPPLDFPSLLLPFAPSTLFRFAVAGRAGPDHPGEAHQNTDLNCVAFGIGTLLGYIGEFEEVDDHRSGKVVIQLIGRINKCGVISPRFNVQLGQIENWVQQLLPARSFGYVVLTTSAGIMDHEEARRKHVAGKILGFFY